jgi:hypothetical protein
MPTSSSPAVGEVLGGTPTGTTGSDGLAIFTLAHTPTDPARVEIFNGTRKLLGVHYTISGQNVTFLAPYIPLAGDVPIADYPWLDTAGAGGDLTTLAAVKRVLKIAVSDVSSDDSLAPLITSMSARFKQETMRDILLADYVEVRDGNGTKAMEPRQYPVVAVTLAKIDEVEVPAQPAYSAGETPPYGWVLIDDRVEIESGFPYGLPYPDGGIAGDAQPAIFRKGNGNVTLEYSAGYATVPADIDQAVAKWVAYEYRSWDRLGQRSKALDGGGSVSYMTEDAPPDVQAVIDRYKRMQI